MTGKYPFAHGVRSNSGYVLADSNDTLAEAFRAEGYATHAETADSLITRRVGLDQGFTDYRDVDSVDVVLKEVRVSGGELTYAKKTLRERPAPDISARGIEFLESHLDQPFFLWLHYADPHLFYSAPPEFTQQFPENPYYAEVAFVDSAIGVFMSNLQRLGLEGRTLVVLTGAQGEGLGDHGEQTHGYMVYESTIHVPLIVWGAPGSTVGKRVATPVRTLDIASTVLDLAELAPLLESQGVSLSGHLGDDGGGPENLLIYGESIEAYASFGLPVLRYVREGPWKYIHKANPELFNLDQDPGELENRISDQPEKLKALREKLEALISQAPAFADPTAVPLEDALSSLDVSGKDVSDVLLDVQELSSALAVLGLTGRTGDARRAQLEEAAGRFEALAERHPNGQAILLGWTSTLDELQRTDETVPLLARAVALAQSDNRTRLRYVRALQEVGELSLAETEARKAIEYNGCGAFEIAYLSSVLKAQQHFEQQGEFLNERLIYCGTDAVRNEYAFFLATSIDERYRNGALALELVTAITSKPSGMRLEYVDTLAAAHAEVGDMASAVAIQRQAVKALEAREGSPELLASFREHLKTYEAGKPLREP
jgi:hypothetical protein